MNSKIDLINPHVPRRGNLNPFRAFIEQRRRQRAIQQHLHQADPRSFDWDWKAAGYNRIAAVNLLLGRIPEPRYLEIGCAENALFDSVPVRDKTGVDPVAGGTHRMTSDAFFAQNRALFDLVFIDGLHTYEQARRDLVHAIEFLKPSGWILLHDMLPHNWLEHHVPMIWEEEWTGDVWKLGFELVRTPGIEFRLLKIDHGVGVVRVTGERPALADRSAELAAGQFAYLYEHIGELPLVSWEEALAWLQGKE